MRNSQRQTSRASPGLGVPRTILMCEILHCASASPSVKWGSSWPAAQGDSPFQRALVPGDKHGAWQQWQQENSASKREGRGFCR